MKITGVKLFESSLSDGCLVELQTANALTGIGIGAPGTQILLETLVKDVLLGEDPRAVSSLWQKMSSWCAGQEPGALPRSTAATLDVAIWDLKAKANDEPLWKTLGGSRPHAPVHGSYSNEKLADGDLSDRFAALSTHHGIHAGILRAGADSQADIRRMKLLHTALARSSPAPALMLDAGGTWSPEQAIAQLRVMEQEFDLTWVEAPVEQSDLQGIKKVSENVAAAVCAGRNLDTLEAYLPYLQNHALDIVQVSIEYAGISGALQIADAAYGYELPVTLCASPGNVYAHAAAVMPYFMSMEVIDTQTTNGDFTTDVCIENGRAVVGDKPGNGLGIAGGSR